MPNDTPEEKPVESAEQTEESRPEAAAESGEPPVSQATPSASEAPAPSEAPASEQPQAESPAATAEAPAEPESAAEQLTLGEGPPPEAEQPPEPAHEPVIRGKIDKTGAALATGRRKTAVARVRLKEGAGKLSINGRPLETYFCIERDREMVEAPLKATGNHGKVDVWVRVNGGGTTGQTGAIVLGIARALEARDPGLHHVLHESGYLTRDDRMVERKKYGYKKARKSFQFSKR